MFPFTGDSKKSSQPEPRQDAEAPPPAEPHPLDAMTDGLFSAATSGERSERLRAWLAGDPDEADMQAVYKELSAKDKGAAKALRERLDELRRARAQDAMVAQWQEKAEQLLATERMNIADGIAWERDAAAAGAPLSREPLAGLRAQLAQRIEAVEDLQQQVMVRVEAAALLTQRVELLSTKPWADAAQARPGLARDVAQWRDEAAAITANPQWAGVDLRYPPQLDAAQEQLQAVWDAFVPALEQAEAAAADAKAALPPVQVWADEIKAARAGGGTPRADGGKSAQNQQKAATARQVVEAGVKLLEHAVAAGNTKDVNSARQALRRTLKTHGQWIDDALEARVHAALVSAGELQGWQRWSADKAREQLVARAEGLLRKRKVKAAPAQAQSEAPEATSAAEAKDGRPQPASELQQQAAAPAVPAAPEAAADEPVQAVDHAPAAPAAQDAEGPATDDAAPTAAADVTDAAPDVAPPWRAAPRRRKPRPSRRAPTRQGRSSCP